MLLEYVASDDDAARDLLTIDAETYGEPSLFARAVANNPDVLAARLEYVRALRDAGGLDERLAELAYATVSVANDCEYCVASHTTQLVEHVGLDDHEVQALVDVVRDADDSHGSGSDGPIGDGPATHHVRDADRLVETFDERERVVTAFAYGAAAVPKRITASDVESLAAAGFDDAAVVQLVAIIAAAGAANTIADTLDILPQDEPDAPAND